MSDYAGITNYPTPGDDDPVPTSESVPVLSGWMDSTEDDSWRDEGIIESARKGRHMSAFQNARIVEVFTAERAASAARIDVLWTALNNSARLHHGDFHGMVLGGFEACQNDRCVPARAALTSEAHRG